MPDIHKIDSTTHNDYVYDTPADMLLNNMMNTKSTLVGSLP